MMSKALAAVIALAGVTAAHAAPMQHTLDQPRYARRPAIAFADHGGVRDWRAVTDREIWFEDNHRRWYRAELFSPAFDLPFTEAIAIDARPTGTLDKFGGIIVRGRHYSFASFEQMPGPPPRKQRRH